MFAGKLINSKITNHSLFHEEYVFYVRYIVSIIREMFAGKPISSKTTDLFIVSLKVCLLCRYFNMSVCQ